MEGDSTIYQFIVQGINHGMWDDLTTRDNRKDALIILNRYKDRNHKSVYTDFRLILKKSVYTDFRLILKTTKIQLLDSKL